MKGIGREEEREREGERKENKLLPCCLAWNLVLCAGWLGSKGFLAEEEGRGEKEESRRR